MNIKLTWHLSSLVEIHPTMEAALEDVKDMLEIDEEVHGGLPPKPLTVTVELTNDPVTLPPSPCTKYVLGPNAPKNPTGKLKAI